MRATLKHYTDPRLLDAAAALAALPGIGVAASEQVRATGSLAARLADCLAELHAKRFKTGHRASIVATTPASAQAAVSGRESKS